MNECEACGNKELEYIGTHRGPREKVEETPIVRFYTYVCKSCGCENVKVVG